jgi:hypothetical protein
MRHVPVFIAALVLVAAACTARAESNAPLVLHVAPHGDDTAAGQHPDAPLASMAGARDRIRALRKELGTTLPARVHFAPGRYPVTEAVRFRPEDSHATYAGAEEAPSVLSGGRRIAGWQQDGERWYADLPEARDSGGRFSSLWVNGVRRTPARTPNRHGLPLDPPDPADFLAMDGPVMESPEGGGEAQPSSTRFRYRAGDVQRWASLDDAVFVIYHSWATSLLRPAALDEDARILTFTGPARWPFGKWQPDQRYYVEHLFEALDAPGEWYLHRGQGRLYYLPLPGEDLATAEVIAPVAPQLIVVEGDLQGGVPVENLHFENLEFRHTDHSPGEKGLSDAQAAFTVDAAVQFTAARACGLSRCVIANTGNYGLWFRFGSRHCAVRDTLFTDLGAGGARIGEGASATTPHEEVGHNTIERCYLQDGGNRYRSAVGVWIGRSSHNTVARNEISDFRYTGISVGWSWGYAESSANHNVIEYNHIHHIGLGQLNDMGGIYTLGVSPGTVLRGNVIHDVVSHPRLYGGWGLYTDEGSTGIILENNFVYNTTTGGFHQHYGRDNLVRNNVFAYSHGPQIIRSREEDHNSFHFERNIVYFNNGQLFGSTWKNNQWTLDHNVYWDTSGAPITARGRSLDAWRDAGHDRHSIVADPGFDLLEAGNFRLKPDSPALALGFQPFDPTQAGFGHHPAWEAHRANITRRPNPLPEPAQP